MTAEIDAFKAVKKTQIYGAYKIDIQDSNGDIYFYINFGQKKYRYMSITEIVAEVDSWEVCLDADTCDLWVSFMENLEHFSESFAFKELVEVLINK